MAGRKWNPEKYAARKPLSTIVERSVKLVRAATGSQRWKQGVLELLDAETGELLAVVYPMSFKDPVTGWDIRTDC